MSDHNGLSLLRLPNECQHMIFYMCWQDGYRSLSSLALTNSELRYNIITYVSQSAQLQFKWTLRKLYAFGIEDKHSIEILSDSTRTEEMDDDRSERPSERPQDMRQLRLRWRPATFAQGGFYMEQVAPVHTAIARGSTKMMEFLLTRRRSEKKRPGQSTPRSEKMLPSTFPGGISLTSLIKIAISAKQNDIAKSLIRRGGYMPDEDDLDTAAITGNKEMVDLILDLRPDLVRSSNDTVGFSPICHAFNSTEQVWRVMVPWLESKGIKVSSFDIGWTLSEGYRDRVVAYFEDDFVNTTRVIDSETATETKDFVMLLERIRQKGFRPDSLVSFICQPRSCNDLQGIAACVDVAGSFPKRLIEHVQILAHRIVRDHSPALGLPTVLLEYPDLLGLIDVLFDRFPGEFTPEIFPRSVLSLVKALKRREFDLTIEGCRELCTRLPVYLGAY